jgi:hypothetical protein
VNIKIIACYFGESPSYFQAWLDSCSMNDKFTWILFSDINIKNFRKPDNVLFISASINSIRSQFSDFLGFDVSLNRPYKLCDFRGLYWILIENLGLQYDYWGYCDLDVIFGRLDKFITVEMLAKYERIFGVGHLSIFKKSIKSKIAFSLPHPYYSWKTVLQTEKSYGFDEHSGLNLIWYHNLYDFYEDESVVMDFDPQYSFLRLVYLPHNKRKQAFSYKNGILRQTYKRLWFQNIDREFAYAHFQKRKIKIYSLIQNKKLNFSTENGELILTENIPETLGFTSKAYLNSISSILRTWVRFFKKSIRNKIISAKIGKR